MNSQQAMVRQFHHSLGSTIGRYPAIRDRELAVKLIMEEAMEFAASLGFDVKVEVSDEEFVKVFSEVEEGFEKPDLVEAVDAIGDLLYVTYGAAIRLGVDIEPFFTEIHNSNMAKLGGGMRADGKFLKPEGWQPPDIAGLLERAKLWGEDPSGN